ncbi:uncharacterized protein LOC110019295 [Phalaenopsis equestris]|uniref:uncharacterized protein LOC110019295 n=1 Tax=Phalaenopsis equestris TaxID=78828 RepID=UPI0009E31800|nr:uncharacterized protein LOC110019295 [Phalaenopsis equestris]
MVLTRIIFFNRLISSRTTPISLDTISRREFFPVFIVDSSPFFLTRGISSLVGGDSKPAKPKSLSSIFADSSADSQSKKPLLCPSDVKAKWGKRDENKQQQIVRASMFCHMQEKKFPEELSPEAALLLKVLQEELYVKLQPNEVRANLPSRHLLRLAAEKLGQRHQEIAKWLSGSHLKKVALLGCPSIERKTVFASKRLRSFFNIQEDIICRGCKLKTSCKFVNQRVDKVERVILADVMRLLTILAFDAVPQQLSVPSDVKLSVDKLLKEAINLSA